MGSFVEGQNRNSILFSIDQKFLFRVLVLFIALLLLAIPAQVVHAGEDVNPPPGDNLPIVDATPDTNIPDNMNQEPAEDSVETEPSAGSLLSDNVSLDTSGDNNTLPNDTSPEISVVIENTSSNASDSDLAEDSVGIEPANESALSDDGELETSGDDAMSEATDMAMIDEAEVGESDTESIISEDTDTILESETVESDANDILDDSSGDEVITEEEESAQTEESPAAQDQSVIIPDPYFFVGAVKHSFLPSLRHREDAPPSPHSPLPTN